MQVVVDLFGFLKAFKFLCYTVMLKNRSTAIALVISTIMIVSAFSMVYAGGFFNATEANGVINAASNISASSGPISKQPVQVSNEKLMPYIDAKQIALNTNNDIKYLGRQYSSLSGSQNLFPVYFNQTGLPIGDQWNITINGVSRQTFNLSYGIYLPQGNYDYTIPNVGNFYPAVGGGVFNLTTSGVAVNVYFQSSMAVNSTLIVDNSSLIQGIHYSNEMNSKPYSAIYNPFNGFYYVADIGNGSVSVLNGTTGNVYKTVKVGLSPVSMTVDPYNGMVYVADSGSSKVSVISPNLSLFENLTIMHNPSYVLYDPVSGYLFVSNYSDKIGALSPSGVIAYTSFNSDVRQMALDSNNGNVFVKTSLVSIYSGIINPNLRQVYYISSTGKIIDGFNVSANIIPNSITFDTVLNSLYSVSAIDPTHNLIETTSSGHVIETWNLGYSPNDIFYDSYTGDIIILSYNSENTTLYSYSGGMNFMGTIYLAGEIHDIAFSNAGQILPDSAEGDVYSAFPIISTREVSLTETGLNSGTVWGFSYSGHVFLTESRIMNFTTLLSPLDIKFLNVTGYAVKNDFAVPYGAGLFQSLVQYQRTYNVVISEKGLPSGVIWNATIDNVTYYSTMGDITTNLTNGTYSLLLSRSGDYYPDPLNTTLYINGSSLSEVIAFSASKFAVNVFQSGLPLGSAWYLNLSNGEHFVSKNHTLSFLVPNGTYYYTISSGNKTYRPFSSSGSFAVNGVSLNLPVNFTIVTYTVNVTEKGLPAGVFWYFELDEYGNSIELGGNSYIISLQNGTYSYSVKSSESSYYPAVSSGTFSIRGHGLNLSILFRELTFKVIFSESGLPAGTSWSVNISSGLNFKTVESSASIMLPNGTYEYSASVANKTFTPVYPAAKFVVNGSAVTVNMDFKMVLYNLTLSLNAVPTNTNWSLFINGKNVSTFSSPQTVLSLPNGTYSYSVIVWNHIYSSTAGNFTINGQNAILYVHISEVKYSLSVYGKGLPSGSLWYLNLSNGVNLYSSSDLISVLLTNGTYHYFLGSGNKLFHPVFPAGTITVQGSNVTMTLDFELTVYNVTFTGQNQVNGNWYVNLTNGNSSGPIQSGASHSFELSNGTYEFVIGVSNSSFRSSVTEGVFTVNGSYVNIPVSFYTVTYEVTFTYNLHNVPWMVVIGNESEFSSGKSISFNLPNGTYSYSALLDRQENGKYTTYINGTVTVKGNNVNLDLVFKKLNRVVVNVMMPPLNSEWILSVNGTLYRSNLPTMILKLPSGNYSALFEFNITLPNPNIGHFRQPGKVVPDSYINITVPFYLNVSMSMPVSVFIFPSPGQINILVISGPIFPPPVPFGPIPPMAPPNQPFPVQPPPLAGNFQFQFFSSNLLPPCLTRPGIPIF